MTQDRIVRWGMLSTAGIGAVLAEAMSSSRQAEFVALASRDAGRAAAAARELGIPRSYGTYEELLADEAIDAVYVPLPVALHTPWTIAALQAGKHVLCEKPFAMTAADADRCFAEAERADRFVVEALMWRHHPQSLLARDLVAAGAVGQVATIRAALSVDVPAGDIRRTGALGGGAHLDLGCYCVSAIRLFGGEPRRVAASSVVDDAPGADGCDLRTAALLELDGGAVGVFDVALDFPRRDELEIIGTAGKIVVPDPWLCRQGRVHLESLAGERTTYEADPTGAYRLSGGGENVDAYRIEIETVSRVFAGRAEPTFGRADAVAQAAALEAVREAAATGGWVTPASPGV